MTTARIIDYLPDIYNGILPDFFEKTIPRETAATCESCAMWQPATTSGKENKTLRSFSRESKCCTHYPNIPNYLLGGFLSHKKSDDAKKILDIISNSPGHTPRGIVRPKKIQFLMENSQRSFFGRSKTLICPFFDKEKGYCTIRPFWDAVCNTWFCKYVKGYDGFQFWVAIRKYLSYVEQSLIQFAMYNLNCNPENIENLVSNEQPGPLSLGDLDDLPLDRNRYLSQWGKWAGREIEFYKKCYELVLKMTRPQFEEITGITQKINLAVVKSKYSDLFSTDLPRVLKKNSSMVEEKIEGDQYLIMGYSMIDPFLVPKKLYEILSFFDGNQDVEATCKMIKEHTGFVPDHDLLVELYRFRILTT
ncbi:conserved hypothetical protein [Desulfamplus magnetovallimortis]|uniref:Uncharacterized protein n=1 Tax=Desulfamplus magnetovallimortis TaxID=1246637 RepID=A0A1W1H9J3_9BACT|nr:hypothetical protein [Desulfamplus magnetovallimortis]SLM29141.1 conserved hypothetical protein [Desulfamplus magnetovallimortis]